MLPVGHRASGLNRRIVRCELQLYGTTMLPNVRGGCPLTSNPHLRGMIVVLKVCLIVFALLYVLPLGIAALLYRVEGSGTGWRTADRSSIGVLPPPAQHPAALVRIFSAKTVRWRGIFASHSWIVFKPAEAPSYTRYDYTAWGELPIRINGFEPDGRWFGHTPQVVFAADGDCRRRPAAENSKRHRRLRLA